MSRQTREQELEERLTELVQRNEQLEWDIKKLREKLASATKAKRRYGIVLGRNRRK